MKVDSTHHGRECESERGGVLSTVVLRFKLLEERYPSASQSLLSILDQAIVSGTSFVSAVIIGRLTTPDQLGLYYLVLSIVIIGAAIEDCVVTAPYLVYCRRREGRELEEYSGSVWIQHLVLCAMSIVILLAIIAILSITGPPKIMPGLWVLLGAVPLIFLRQAVRRFAIANLHVRSAIALDVVVAAVQLGGFALLGYFESLNLASIFAVMGGACGLACFGLYWIDPLTIRFVRERFVPDWHLNWAFAKWALRTYLVGQTTSTILLWILGLTVGAAAAGVFGACSTLIGMTNVLLLGVNNVLTPQAAHAFATGGPQDLRHILLRTANFLTITLGGFCLLIMFTGDWLMVLAFGASGQGTGAILAVLALSMLISSAGVVAGSGLWAIDEPRANFLADVSCLTVTLMAAFLIVPLGALGAALANLAGMATATVVRTITFSRYLHRAAAEHSDPESRLEARSESQALSAEGVGVSCVERGHCLVDAAEAAI